jgi:lipoprotein-anchoring transpeptidase ErfK/SrfK
MSAPIFGSFGRIGTALLAALAVCILPVRTAQAQFLFGPQYSSSWGNQVSFGHKRGHGNYHSVQTPARQSQFRSGTRKGTVITVSFRHKHRPEHDNLVSFRHKGQHRHAKSELAKKAEPQDTAKTELAKKAEPQDAVKTELDAVKTELAKKDSPKGPLQIIISIADQRISLYDNGALIARSSVSTGVQGYPTPLGIFSVISKERWHRSNIYSAAPMPYMQRITWSGIALHAGVLPGYPASHGCIRLSNDFAIRLWHLTERGTRVIIAPEDVQPVEIANRHLSVPKPKVPSESETAAVAGSGTTAHSSAPAALVRGDELAFATLRVAPQKVVPISVFVSRKSSRLFVRKGLTPLFDIPVEIHSPEEPLGTHVFTAMEPQKDSASRWTVVSMPRAFSHASAGTAQERKEPGERTAEATSPVSLPDSADAALDRIEIPQDVVEQISELLTPGSSLIISDYGMSSETREDTDFIVIAH